MDDTRPRNVHSTVVAMKLHGVKETTSAYSVMLHQMDRAAMAEC